jgi:hypothetical protein
MVFALLAACAPPCAEGPRFTDPDDLAPSGMLDAIETRWDEWMGWTHVDDLCISTVQVADVDEGIGALTQDDHRITVDPEALDPGGVLESQLCRALYRERGYSWAPPLLFGSEDIFAAECAARPEGLGYFRVGEDVCGDRFQSDTDRFFADLFVDYSPRDDGGLGATLGEQREIALRAGDDWHTLEWAAVGDRLALLRTTDRRAAIEWIDLESDSVVRGLDIEVSGSDVLRLFGGLQAGALWWERADFTTEIVTLVPEQEPTSTDVVDPGRAYDGVVDEGSLFATDGPFGTIAAYDLADAARTDLELPAIQSEAPEMLAGAVHATPGGVLVELNEAEIEESDDTVTISVYREPLARFDTDSDTWAELTEMPEFDGSMLAPERVMVGATFGDFPVLGAYDEATDRFLVSDDLCLEGSVQFVGDRAWQITVEDEVVIAKPIDLAM